jgi:hypothetical protein
MPKERVLIAVKTYPTLSTNYGELVCTAGFRENGEWVRIYPVPFRQLAFESQYKKYDWIELELVKNTSDFRVESYRPANPADINVVGHIDADGDTWSLRREKCLSNVYTNLEALIAEAKDRQIGTSLAVFRPSRVLDFTYEAVEEEWDPAKVAALKAKADQGSLFDEERSAKNVLDMVRKLPFVFRYKFLDDQGRESNLMIEDWEVGALYWNSLERHRGIKSLAVLDVKKKYLDDFAKKKDLHFFLGTTKQHHYISVNPFIIIGAFYPKAGLF